MINLSSAKFEKFCGSKWHLSHLQGLRGILNTLSVGADVTGIARNVTTTVLVWNWLLIIVGANCK